MDNPHDFILFCLLLQAGAVVFSLIPRNGKVASASGHIILCAGLVAGLIATVTTLMNPALVPFEQH